MNPHLQQLTNLGNELYQQFSTMLEGFALPTLTALQLSDVSDLYELGADFARVENLGLEILETGSTLFEAKIAVDLGLEKQLKREDLKQDSLETFASKVPFSKRPLKARVGEKSLKKLENEATSKALIELGTSFLPSKPHFEKQLTRSGKEASGINLPRAVLPEFENKTAVTSKVSETEKKTTLEKKHNDQSDALSPLSRISAYEKINPDTSNSMWKRPLGNLGDLANNVSKTLQNSSKELPLKEQPKKLETTKLSDTPTENLETSIWRKPLKNLSDFAQTIQSPSLLTEENFVDIVTSKHSDELTKVSKPLEPDTTQRKKNGQTFFVESQVAKPRTSIIQEHQFSLPHPLIKHWGDKKNELDEEELLEMMTKKINEEYRRFYGR